MKSSLKKENTIEELQHASPVRTGKHFQSFLIDCILVSIVSYLIFLCGNLIAVNTNAYKEAEIIVKEEIDYYNDFVEKSRAVEFEIVDGEKTRKDLIVENDTGFTKIVLENVNRALFYSYKQYGDFCVQFGEKINQEYLDIIKLSISDNGLEYDDNISYFYTNYILNSDNTFNVSFDSLLEAKQHVQSVYKDAFGSDADKFFTFNIEENGVPILKSEAAYYIYYFIYIAADEDITKIGEDYSFTFYTSYSSMLSKAENIIIQSEPYYSTHYMNYYDYNAVLGRCVNVALIISIFIAYILVILVPKIILGHGRTIGRYLLKQGEISVYNEPISIVSVIIKSIFGIIGYLGIIPILYMFAPFYGSFTTLYMPFVGDIPLLYVVIVIILLVLINGCVMLFTKDKVGVDSLLTRTVLVDRHYIDELLFDEE